MSYTIEQKIEKHTYIYEVEKFFDNMKNDIDKKRLRTSDKEIFLGRLFLDFIILVVYSQISKIARQEQIVKDYTI